MLDKRSSLILIPVVFLLLYLPYNIHNFSCFAALVPDPKDPCYDVDPSSGMEVACYDSNGNPTCCNPNSNPNPPSPQPTPQPAPQPVPQPAPTPTPQIDPNQRCVGELGPNAFYDSSQQRCVKQSSKAQNLQCKQNFNQNSEFDSAHGTCTGSDNSLQTMEKNCQKMGSNYHYSQPKNRCISVSTSDIVVPLPQLPSKACDQNDVTTSLSNEECTIPTPIDLKPLITTLENSVDEATCNDDASNSGFHIPYLCQGETFHIGGRYDVNIMQTKTMKVGIKDTLGEYLPEGTLKVASIGFPVIADIGAPEAPGVIYGLKALYTLATGNTMELGPLTVTISCAEGFDCSKINLFHIFDKAKDTEVREPCTYDLSTNTQSCNAPSNSVFIIGTNSQNLVNQINAQSQAISPPAPAPEPTAQPEPQPTPQVSQSAPIPTPPPSSGSIALGLAVIIGILVIIIGIPIFIIMKIRKRKQSGP